LPVVLLVVRLAEPVIPVEHQMGVIITITVIIIIMNHMAA